MPNISSFSTFQLLCLLAYGLTPAFAQNTFLTTSSALPGGGTGTSTVAIGPGNTYSNATSSASANVFIGSNAGIKISDGNYDTFVGWLAGSNNTNGRYNAFIGARAGASNTSGRSNTFIGGEAGSYNTFGRENTFTGYLAGWYHTTGSQNTFTGTYAGLENTTGSHNTYLGYSAYGTGSNSANLQRATAIGDNARVAVNDGLVLGDTTNVKVGIGTAYPNQRFTLRGNMNFVAYDNSMMLKNQPFLHFNEHESLALGLDAEIPAGAEKTLVLGSDETDVQIPGILSTYQPNAGQFLTMNQLGKLTLTKPRVQVASVADWSDKVFEESYALRPLNEVEAFVKKNKHLPGVPSAAAMVAEGMESAAFNAKLLEKIEELTLYVVALEKRLKELEKK